MFSSIKTYDSALLQVLINPWGLREQIELHSNFERICFLCILAAILSTVHTVEAP